MRVGSPNAASGAQAEQVDEPLDPDPALFIFELEAYPEPKALSPGDLRDIYAVVFGATVTILDDNDEEKTYQIVGEDEIDIKNFKISWKSPLAKGLLGKKVGDEIQIKKPTDESWVEIIKIDFF